MTINKNFLRFHTLPLLPSNRDLIIERNKRDNQSYGVLCCCCRVDLSFRALKYNRKKSYLPRKRTCFLVATTQPSEKEIKILKSILPTPVYLT